MTVFEKWARIPAKQPALFTIAVLAITVILSFSIYWGTFKYEYLDWDDNTLVEQNAYVMDPAWARTKAQFIPKMTPGPHLPLRATSYKFDLHVLAPAFGGPNQNHNTRARYHHITNTWLYALNGVLLFFLFRKLLNPWAAAIATLIWVAHPVHVEAVSWVSGRKEMLSGAFLIGGFLAYIVGTERLRREPGNIALGISAGVIVLAAAAIWIHDEKFASTHWMFGFVAMGLTLAAPAIFAAGTPGESRNRSWGIGLHVLAVFCTLCAMLSKPVAIAFPPILLAYELGYRPHASRKAAGDAPTDGFFGITWLPTVAEMKGLFARLLPHAAVILWGVWITMERAGATQVVKDNATWNAAPKSPLISGLSALWLDVYHLVAPLNLSSLYDVKSDQWYWSAFAGIAILAAIPIGTIWLLRKSPKTLLWLAWWVWPLFLVSGVVPIAAAHADRYLYLPAIALAVALGVLLSTAAFGSDEETGVWERWMAGALVVCIVGGFSVLSFQRTRVWAKDHLLWGDAVRKNPDLPSARNNYGAALMNAGDADGALAQYYASYKLQPTLDVAQFNIAATEMRKGNVDVAQKYAEEFVAQHPEMATGWILVGQLYHTQYRMMIDRGLPKEAAAPKLNQAVGAYRKGCDLGIDPDSMVAKMDKASACSQLAITMAGANNTTGALLAFQAGLDAAPNNKPLILNRVRFYRSRKMFAEARRDLDEILKVNPGDVEVLRMYAIVLLETNDCPRALEFIDLVLHSRGAVQSDPGLRAQIAECVRVGGRPEVATTPTPAKTPVKAAVVP